MSRTMKLLELPEAETVFMSGFSWCQPGELTTHCFDLDLLLSILQQDRF